MERVKVLWRGVLREIVMHLFGLGSFCTGPVMSPEQIYQIASDVGFPSDTAVKMTAIALRESGGCTTAYNGGVGGSEDSYGLWQINVKGNPGIPVELGIGKQDLFEPYNNARAAYRLWNGNDANLDIAWYINRSGYKQAYEKYLPTAQAAAGVMAPSLPEVAATGEPSLAPGPPNVNYPAILVLSAITLFGIVLLSPRS